MLARRDRHRNAQLYPGRRKSRQGYVWRRRSDPSELGRVQSVVNRSREDHVDMLSISRHWQEQVLERGEGGIDLEA